MRGDCFLLGRYPQVGDIVDGVANALQTEKKNFKVSFRDRGKWRSITLNAPVNTADEVYAAYAAIDRAGAGVSYSSCLHMRSLTQSRNYSKHQQRYEYLCPFSVLCT